MNYNAPSVFTLSINLGEPYTLSSPNILVTKPDGMTDSAIATVSPSETTLVNPHIFSYMYVPSQAGLHKIRFQFLSSTFQTGQTLNKYLTAWIPWNDVYPEVRSLLGVTYDQLNDLRIGLEFYNLFTEFLDYTNNSLPAYRLFTQSYQDGFDLAMVKLLASRLRPTIGGKRPTGEVTLFKKGTTTVQYGVGPKQEFTPEILWWEQGMAILDATIPEIGRVLDMDRIGDEVGTRGELAKGNFHPKAGWFVNSAGGSNQYGWNEDGAT